MADQSVSELVFRGTDGELFTTSERIAEGTKADHASVIKLVRRYQADLEEFGKVGFEIRPNPQGSPTEIAILAEPQATLMMNWTLNELACNITPNLRLDLIASAQAELVRADTME
ncbi:hypothetical protein GWK36_00715 [Caldichromatium japonicum]|uniref:Uncharacterized protein n=1 Tax=Caldichromatium japonicum TaxID=2699430 RepID=A0A6G7V9L5_9GAMM|nr:Rha family transcriptional regulator [Caldichromatium japonicum]QIK36763.1 hypothetical protein GWK36_00715 [Caldichromatium japonicum]